MSQHLWYEIGEQPFWHQEGIHVWLTVSPGHTKTGISVIQENERTLHKALRRANLAYGRPPQYIDEWTMSQAEEPRIEMGERPWDPGAVRTIYHGFMPTDEGKLPDCNPGSLETRLQTAGFHPRPQGNPRS